MVFPQGVNPPRHLNNSTVSFKEAFLIYLY